VEFKQGNHEKPQVRFNANERSIGLILLNYLFHTPMAREIHPATNNNPPIGVIAPMAFMPDNAIKYKLPENRIMPIPKNMADLLTHFELI